LPFSPALCYPAAVAAAALSAQAVAVVPFLMSGGTDSKFYAHLSEHGVLRFVPYRINNQDGDLSRIHGTNERVRVEDYLRGICTYRRMMQLLLAGEL
jgi:carboxypeptidase PM20D1